MTVYRRTWSETVGTPDTFEMWVDVSKCDFCFIKTMTERVAWWNWIEIEILVPYLWNIFQGSKIIAIIKCKDFLKWILICLDGQFKNLFKRKQFVNMVSESAFPRLRHDANIFWSEASVRFLLSCWYNDVNDDDLIRIGDNFQE